jgi:hypothetical protein
MLEPSGVDWGQSAKRKQSFDLRLYLTDSKRVNSQKQKQRFCGAAQARTVSNALDHAGEGFSRTPESSIISHRRTGA